MGGRQRLYQDDKRITIVLEKSLYDKIQKVAKMKGLTMSRLLALVCKKAFSEKITERVEHAITQEVYLAPQDAKPKVELGELDFE